MDSLNFLLEDDPEKLLQNPIVKEYIETQRKSTRSKTWINMVAKLSKYDKIIKTKSKR